MPVEEASSKKKRVEMFPEQWENSFGEEFYDHIMENEAFYMSKNMAWQVHRPSIPAPGMMQYSVPSEKELQAVIETLTREAVANHVG